MSEIWTRWEPVAGLKNKYDIDALSSDERGFIVKLSDRDVGSDKLVIHFEDWVEAYRCADETLRCRVVVELNKQYGEELYGNWTFFTVTNSSYIAWLSEQSCTISDGMQLVHYSILAANTVLDIAAISKPTVYKI